MQSQEQRNEARIFAARLCLTETAVLQWMRKHELYTILDVKNHFRGLNHSESMDAMVREIWADVLA